MTISHYLWVDVECVGAPLPVVEHSMPSPVPANGQLILNWEPEKERLLTDLAPGSNLAAESRRLSVGPPQHCPDVLKATEVAYRLIHRLLMNEAHLNGWSRLHGALLDLEGNRVALIGPSGAGKTGLGLRLKAAGARLLSDEGVLIRDGLALPLPRRIHVKDSARSSLPAAVFEQATRLDYDPPLWCLDLNHDAQIEALPLAAVILLADGDQPTAQLLPTESELALRLVLDDSSGYLSGVEAASQTRSRLVSQVARLLAEVDIWRLTGYFDGRGVALLEDLIRR